MKPLTVKLRSNGEEVLARLYEGEPSPITYSNRTQAATRAAELGAGWFVAQFLGRPFYVVKDNSHASDCATGGAE